MGNNRDRSRSRVGRIECFDRPARVRITAGRHEGRVVLVSEGEVSSKGMGIHELLTRWRSWQRAKAAKGAFRNARNGRWVGMDARVASIPGSSCTHDRASVDMSFYLQRLCHVDHGISSETTLGCLQTGSSYSLPQRPETSSFFRRRLACSNTTPGPEAPLGSTVDHDGTRTRFWHKCQEPRRTCLDSDLYTNDRKLKVDDDVERTSVLHIYAFLTTSMIRI